MESRNRMQRQNPRDARARARFLRSHGSFSEKVCCQLQRGRQAPFKVVLAPSSRSIALIFTLVEKGEEGKRNCTVSFFDFFLPLFGFPFTLVPAFVYLFPRNPQSLSPSPFPSSSSSSFWSSFVPRKSSGFHGKRWKKSPSAPT